MYSSYNEEPRLLWNSHISVGTSEGSCNRQSLGLAPAKLVTHLVLISSQKRVCPFGLSSSWYLDERTVLSFRTAGVVHWEERMGNRGRDYTSSWTYILYGDRSSRISVLALNNVQMGSFISAILQVYTPRPLSRQGCKHWTSLHLLNMLSCPPSGSCYEELPSDLPPSLPLPPLP